MPLGVQTRTKCHAKVFRLIFVMLMLMIVIMMMMVVK